jgi:threonine/homoserine/homoserine lactone efflux protein
MAYSLACLVLFITPGPDMSLFLAKTLSGGRRAGIAAMAGAMIGCIVHSLLAAFGISALIAASPPAFLVLKVVGALYLFWLAIEAIRNGSALNVAASATTPAPFWRTLALGVSINLTNPKVVLFFVTFLPQFIDAQDPSASRKLLFLGIYFVALTAPLAVLLILGAERMLGAIRHHPRLLRVIDWVFAGVFSAFAVRILMTQTR